MHISKKVTVLTLVILSFIGNAQEESVRYTDSNKGKIFFSWGGNRENYSSSDIHFKGADYDFTINDATAHDKPKGWHIDYVNPSRMTIPQTNFKLGYFISDKYTVAIGVDHMKYVMNRNRIRNVSGTIDLPLTEPGSIYNGSYPGTAYLVSEDFLKFEHTDGLNYVYVEVGRQDDISSVFKIENTDIFQVNLNGGLAIGGLYPKTNTTLLGKERYDEFHVSGYGVSAKAGINFTVYKYFFLQLDLKGGNIDMDDIRTTKSTSDSASQNFFFLERIISFGGIFRL
ncbi:hypothetical protein MWU59_09205 [Flavobacteriaceae bacterium F08102]|nr:hypothetical protein [Flavobacteriaceae bacterium F08102]